MRKVNIHFFGTVVVIIIVLFQLLYLKNVESTYSDPILRKSMLINCFGSCLNFGIVLTLFLNISLMFILTKFFSYKRMKIYKYILINIGYVVLYIAMILTFYRI